MAKFRILGISFDHMHMGDLLRQVHDHPDAEIAGIFDPDPARMASAIASFSIPPERVFTNLDACLATRADLAILCSPPPTTPAIPSVWPPGACMSLSKNPSQPPLPTPAG